MNLDRRKNGRHAPDEFISVFDCSTGQPLGTLVNMSSEGAMLLTDGPIKPLTVFHCRVELKKPILGRSEVFFEAECRWCRRNVTENRWESGYHLKATGIDAELIGYMVLGFSLCDWGIADPPVVKTADTTNRRSSVRYDLHDPLPLYDLHTYRQLGTLVDLSVDGFRIFTEKPMTPGDLFQCRVRLPKRIFRQDFLVMDARCMWVGKHKVDGRYESGHMIVRISKDDAAVILHLIIHYCRAQQTERKIEVIR